MALEHTAAGYRAVVAGATGLVGKKLVRQLLQDPNCSHVVAVVRRPFPDAFLNGLEFRDKLEVKAVDFERLEHALQGTRADVVYCTLGTTIKKAKTREAFRKVDLDYPLALARYAKQAGIRQYAVITAMGSSERSRFFYSRVKGELERKLTELQLPVLHIFRPSLLLGQRGEARSGEDFAAWAFKTLGWLAGPLKSYLANTDDDVAYAMRAAVNRSLQQSGPAVHVYRSNQIASLAAHTTG